GASPRKYGLNCTMPALTNSSVGSSKSNDALGTTVWPSARKCSVKRRLISWVCTVKILRRSVRTGYRRVAPVRRGVRRAASGTNTSAGAGADTVLRASAFRPASSAGCRGRPARRVGTPACGTGGRPGRTVVVQPAHRRRSPWVGTGGLPRGLVELLLALLHPRANLRTERADRVGKVAHRPTQLLGHAGRRRATRGLVDLAGHRDPGRDPGTEPEQAPHLGPPLPRRRECRPAGPAFRCRRVRNALLTP